MWSKTLIDLFIFTVFSFIFLLIACLYYFLFFVALMIVFQLSFHFSSLLYIFYLLYFRFSDIFFNLVFPSLFWPPFLFFISELHLVIFLYVVLLSILYVLVDLIIFNTFSFNFSTLHLPVLFLIYLLLSILSFHVGSFFFTSASLLLASPLLYLHFSNRIFDLFFPPSPWSFLGSI